jgi:succinate dehydrogenase/fumarate reductase flavoprotein subunit
VIDRWIETDVLVIGGGGAACRAAVAAHDAGARTIVALKGRLGASGATVVPGRGVAWQAADGCSSPEDSPEVHLRNILDAGLGMADPRLARLLAYEVIERLAELEAWGLEFIPDPEGIKAHYSGYSCFGDQPRAHGILDSGHGHAGDIVVALARQLDAHDVEIHEQVFVTDLLTEDGACRGALALGPDGQVLAYRARAVVLGAGGARQIYPAEGRRVIDTTGDGYAMATRAGAELTNMEYAQFMLHLQPGSAFSVPGSFWMLYPRLLNRHGQDVLASYLPPGVSGEQAMYERTLHYPFSCRDRSCWLDVAIASEVGAGRGTPEGGLFLDFSGADLRRFVPSRPQHIPEDRARPVVLPEGPVQVRSVAHAINGGVRIDECAASTVRGLYAAGEVAAGPHGADRLGGGMVTNCQVYGQRAGQFAAEYALCADGGDLGRACLEAPLARLRQYGGGEREAEQVLAALQKAAGLNLTVVRNEAGLRALLGQIKELARECLPQVAIRDAHDLRRAIEVENSLLTAELMARAAWMRRESRGSHFRDDYPRQDDQRWRVNIVLRMVAERVEQRIECLGQGLLLLRPSQ